MNVQDKLETPEAQEYERSRQAQQKEQLAKAKAGKGILSDMQWARSLAKGFKTSTRAVLDKLKGRTRADVEKELMSGKRPGYIALKRNPYKERRLAKEMARTIATQYAGNRKNHRKGK